MTTTPIQADRDGNEFELVSRSCPICQVQDERELGLRGGPHHRYGLGIETRVVQCRECSLIYPSPFPIPRDAQKLYGDPDKYFGDGLSTEKVENNRRILRELRRHSAPDSALGVLDVGCGRGELLHVAREEGWNAVGIEFSEAMIAAARERYGVEVRRQSVEELAQTWERELFDVVILNAVLEHVYDPDSMIRSVAQLTKRDGLLYIDVPNEPNLMTLVGNAWNRMRGSPAIFNLQPTWVPFHVFGFNRRSLSRLLGKHGFEIRTFSVWASPHIPAGRDVRDRVKSFVGSQLIRLGNWVAMAPNLTLIASRR